MRVNWLAIIVADIVLFIFGALWYDLLFGKLWAAEMSKLIPQFTTNMAVSAYPFIVSFVMGFFTAYGLARILGWRGDWSISRGAFIGFSAGLLIFGSMTWTDYAYSGFGATLGWINIGFVAIGLAIQGAILSAWKPKNSVILSAGA
jgi:hypothetical protein